MAKSRYPWLRSLLGLLVVLSLAACTVTQRTAPPAEPAESESVPVETEDLLEGWSIVFCPDETIDDNVTIEIGRGDDPATHRFWQSVNPRINPQILLPEDLRHVDKIWIRLTSENHLPVEACVKYDGNATEKLLLSEDEAEEIDRRDRDDCGC